MQIELAPTNADIIIDNVSVKKLPRICGDGLIRNGIFDENSKFWKDMVVCIWILKVCQIKILKY